MNESTSRSNDQQSGIQHHLPPPSTRDRTMTILVADADPLARMPITEHLQARGHRILEAATGSEALFICKATSPSIALLDYDLPGRSGLELAGDFMELGSVPFVFLTRDDDERRAYDATHAGASGYVFKPVPITKLIPLIEAARARFVDRQALAMQIAQLSKTLHSSRQVSLTVGVLMGRMHINEHDAFELLRSHSRRVRRRLEDVAGELLDTKERLNSLVNAIVANKAS